MLQLPPSISFFLPLKFRAMVTRVLQRNCWRLRHRTLLAPQDCAQRTSVVTVMIASCFSFYDCGAFFCFLAGFVSRKMCASEYVLSFYDSRHIFQRKIGLGQGSFLVPIFPHKPLPKRAERTVHHRLKSIFSCGALWELAYNSFKQWDIRCFSSCWTSLSERKQASSTKQTTPTSGNICHSSGRWWGRVLSTSHSA